MTPELTVDSFTNCEVSKDGRRIHLSVTDVSGAPMRLSLSADQAGSLTMTLPRLLTAALKARFKDDSLRFVFPVHDYSLEGADGLADFILSLKTADGFEVSFAVKPELLKQLSLIADTQEPCATRPGPVH